MLRIGAERLTRLCSPSSARSGPEFKGHPWFAATYDFVSRWSEPEFLRRFRSLVAGEATGRVLEIGVGTGANFPYYQRAGQIVAVEPDPFMLGRARRRADRLGLEVEFQQAAAEALPFPDASFDTVVATLVFCSVADQDRSFTEVKRVLRPGGTFRFLEHVRADGRLVGEAPDLLTPLWQQVGAGCHLNRRTSESIEAAGFEIEELRQEGRSSLFPIVAGVARDRDGLP
ncbi:MAG: class I SAM-dependent methyltransferase [Chloroflexi bacterium]|nr:class I SAM-dependent methyltransferase [Chloroflexota bacterium]